MTYLSQNEFETIKWSSIKERFSQYINSIVFKSIC